MFPALEKQPSLMPVWVTCLGMVKDIETNLVSRKAKQVTPTTTTTKKKRKLRKGQLPGVLATGDSLQAAALISHHLKVNTHSIRLVRISMYHT